MNLIVASADASRHHRVPNGLAVRVVIGPTAAGKSALALHLAERRNLSLISADSRQIYKRFDIGTAKPTSDEQALVPHYGIDVAEPTHRYSAQQWASAAREWTTHAASLGREAVVVGGTGFYVRSLVQPLNSSPDLPREKRDALARVLDAQSIDELRRWCARLDPRRAALGRTQLYRAIETALIAGVRLGDLLDHDSTPDAPSTSSPAGPSEGSKQRVVHYLVVDPGPILAQRIAARVDAMIANGWPDEVRALMQQVPPDAPAWLASGYDVMRQHVHGEISLAAAREKITIETRQYAKRQRTWCRHQLRDGAVTLVSPDDSRALERAVEWWDATEEKA